MKYLRILLRIEKQKVTKKADPENSKQIRTRTFSRTHKTPSHCPTARENPNEHTPSEPEHGYLALHRVSFFLKKQTINCSET